MIKTSVLLFKFSGHSYSDDVIDRFNHVLSSMIFLTCFCYVSFRLFGAELFVCFENAYELAIWQDYIQSFCFVTNKYFVSPYQHDNPTDRTEVKINTYYWYPVYFIAQSLLCCCGFWIYQHLYWRTGINVAAITDYLNSKKKIKIEKDDTARKHIGGSLVPNDVVGDPLKDEKRQRNKKVGRHGRKRAARKKPLNDNDSHDSAVTSGCDILSPIQKVLKNEHDQEHSRLMKSIRTFIKQHVHAYSHRPCKQYELQNDVKQWFSAFNINFSAISSVIYKGSFIEPLPSLKVKELVVAATSDGILLFIYRKESNQVIAVGIGEAFTNNGIDECYMHAAMVAREQTNDVTVQLYMYNECTEQKKKLVLLSMYNRMFNSDSSFIPTKFDSLKPPDTVDSSYIEKLIQLKGEKLKGKRKTVPLLCCCRKPCFPLSEERNRKLQNDTMTECTGCKKWFFFKCGAVATTSNDPWYCWSCKLNFPPLVDHCNLHNCNYSSTCPIDGVISACFIFNRDNNKILSKAIDRYDTKNIFEDALQTFMASEINSQKDMLSAKHIFLKRVYKKEYDLEGFEETVVLQHFKERYLAIGDYSCKACNENGTTIAEDYLFFNSIIQSVETTVAEGMQPENFDIRKNCCGSNLEINNKRYRFAIPWVLPLRPLEFTFLRQFTPEKIEELPLLVDVLNNNEMLHYKLGFISFATPGHFIGIIPSRNGWIYYNGLREPAMLPLGEALRKVTVEGGTLNTMYYFINDLPKTTQGSRSQK